MNTGARGEGGDEGEVTPSPGTPSTAGGRQSWEGGRGAGRLRRARPRPRPAGDARFRNATPRTFIDLSPSL